jgi:hypothetical protein
MTSGDIAGVPARRDGIKTRLLIALAAVSALRLHGGANA